MSVSSPGPPLSVFGLASPVSSSSPLPPVRFSIPSERVLARDAAGDGGERSVARSAYDAVSPAVSAPPSSTSAPPRPCSVSLPSPPVSEFGPSSPMSVSLPSLPTASSNSVAVSVGIGGAAAKFTTAGPAPS